MGAINDPYVQEVEAAENAASLVSGDIAATSALDLPPFEDAIAFPDKLPEMPAEIVEGILLETHKMLLTGPSKANKTWCLINLAISVATGGWWIDFKCAQRKVLYIDLETDRRTLQRRISTVATAKEADLSEVNKNLKVWPLRGKSCSLSQIAGVLFNRAKMGDFGMVVIDPAYMVQDGDENNAKDIRIFFATLDSICVRLGCTMVISHHHSKGAQGLKSSIDRGSGSGVFGRAPDAVLDMTELVLDGDTLSTVRESNKLAESKKLTGWRMSFTLREFAPRKPLDLWFSFPLHTLDSTGELESCRPNYGGLSEARRLRLDAENLAKMSTFDAVCNNLIGDKEYCLREEVIDGTGWSKNTVNTWLGKSTRFEAGERDRATSKATIRRKAGAPPMGKNDAATSDLTEGVADKGEGVQGELKLD